MAISNVREYADHVQAVVTDHNFDPTNAQATVCPAQIRHLAYSQLSHRHIGISLYIGCFTYQLHV